MITLARFALSTALVSSSVLIGACSSSPASGEAAAALPAPGSMAPSFSALDQAGKARTVEEFRGRPLVLFFYPADGSPGCTKEACAFRDAWQRYEAANVAVVGVSTNDVSSHAKFAAEHNLPFALLADTEQQVMRAYGVKSTMGFAQRVSILVDADGRVVRVWPDVDPGVHATEVLAAVSALPAAMPQSSPTPAAPTDGAATPTPTPTPTPTSTNDG